MITKRAMEEAQLRGAMTVLATYGLGKEAALGVIGTLGKGVRAAGAAVGKGQGVGKAVSKGWNALGTGGQNLVKGMGAAGAVGLGAGYLAGRPGQDDRRHGY